jgi:hypothetical protein
MRAGFFNQPLIVAPDVAHSRVEDRFFVRGQTDAGRELFLVFTLRGELIRVISAAVTACSGLLTKSYTWQRASRAAGERQSVSRRKVHGALFACYLPDGT